MAMIEDDARDVMIDIINEETGGEIPLAILEIVVDRTLAKLWMKKYKLVPLTKKEQEEDEQTINS